MTPNAPDPIRREIYDKMNSITLEWFTFMTTEEAKKEVKLRLEAIAKIKHMNSDQFYWYDDAMPYETDTANWEPAYANSYFWVQKSGTAYAAITELCDGSKKTQGECYGAIIACVWWGSSRALATTDFNTKYQGVKALHMHKFYKDVAYRDKQIRVAIDTTVHIPGDWLYMKNYNYGKVIKEKGFWKKEWLNQNIRYPWQGENAIYVGKGKYEGLGLVNMTEAEMREEMRINYNRNFKKVIKNGGKVDGVPIQTIRKGADADSKIIWTSQNRLHN